MSISPTTQTGAAHTGASVPDRTHPLVHIIVITYNGRHHLEKCLPSLLRTAYPNFHIVLLDNASSDGSAEYVQAHFPSVEIARHPVNYGFAKGNNLLMERALRAGADYVLLLNDDTIILDADWLTHAVTVAEQSSQVGMVGFDLTTDTGKPLPDALEVSDTKTLLGCALLMKRRVLEDIGLFDETYFAYFEETDLEARAVRAGYALKELNIPLYHAGGGSFGRMPFKFAYLYLRNVVRYSIKNEDLTRALLRPLLIWDVAYNPFPLQKGAEKAQLRRRLQTGSFVTNYAALLAALLWNAVALPHTLSWRVRHNRRAARAHL